MPAKILGSMPNLQASGKINEDRKSNCRCRQRATATYRRPKAMASAVPTMLIAKSILLQIFATYNNRQQTMTSSQFAQESSSVSTFSEPDLAVTAGATVDNVLAHFLQEGLGCVKVGSIATNHKGQSGGFRTAHA